MKWGLMRTRIEERVRMHGNCDSRPLRTDVVQILHVSGYDSNTYAELNTYRILCIPLTCARTNILYILRTQSVTSYNWR